MNKSKGVTREQVEDALAVCLAFNTIGRLADASGFVQPTSEALARAALHASVPDVVISDIAMPHEDGFDLIRHLHAHDAAFRSVEAIRAALVERLSPK